jgi:hypothetical protein
MARLREPKEVRDRGVSKAKDTPLRIPGFNARGNSNQVLQAYKSNLTQQNKFLDLQQKESQHQERLREKRVESQNKQRHEEEKGWRAWNADLTKKQEAENLQMFQNFLFENYAIEDDKRQATLPLEIQKRAAGYVQDAQRDGAGTIKKFKEDYFLEQDTKAKIQKVLPQFSKDRAAKLGKDNADEEIKGILQAPIKEQARLVLGWEQKQAAVAAKKQAEADAVKQDFWNPKTTPEVAGGKVRYGGKEFGEGGLFGSVPVNENLTFEESRQAYTDMVDRAVNAAGGGFVNNAAGAVLKYTPLPRMLVDPNAPIRYGLRKVGEAAAGTIGIIGKGEGLHPTAADLLPFAEPPDTPSPAVPTAEPKAPAPVAPAATGGTTEPPGMMPQADAGELWKQAGSLMSKTSMPQAFKEAPGPSETLAAGVTQPTNLFAGLADTVKGLFTSSPEETEKRRNPWQQVAQKASGSTTPVAPQTPAPAPEPQLQREKESFPSAM